MVLTSFFAAVYAYFALICAFFLNLSYLSSSLSLSAACCVCATLSFIVTRDALIHDYMFDLVFLCIDLLRLLALFIMAPLARHLDT
eukprot:6175095-Pleurochrysis_carterae.AAC.1